MRRFGKLMIALIVALSLAFCVSQQGLAQVTFPEGPDINDPSVVSVRGGDTITCLRDTVYVLVSGRRPDFFGFNINSATWTQLANAQRAASLALARIHWYSRCSCRERSRSTRTPRNPTAMASVSKATLRTLPRGPTLPNDITFDLGQNLNVLIAGEDLAGKGGKFKGELPRGGSVALKMDVNRGRIQIKGKKLDLGPLVGTDFDFHLAVGADYDETVMVRMSSKKDKRSY